MTIQNKDAHRRLIAARTAMVLDQPFWGMLSSRLAIVEDPSCDTAWTDGASIGYNPEFIKGLTHRQAIALVAHETEHCARAHPWRRGGRDHKRFNVAADLAINSDLRKCGFTLPTGALFPEQYGLPEGKSAEWYYDRVPADAGQDQSGGTGSGKGTGQSGVGPAAGNKPDPLGEVRDAPTPVDEAAPTEAGWQQAVVQAAAVAAGQGKLPAGLERLVESAKRSRIDWVSATIRFAQEVSRGDYSWTRPNKRYVAHGMYLPALYSTAVGVIAVFIDTSGSVDGVLLEQFQGVMRDVADQVKPRVIRAGYIDAKLHREDIFERGEPIIFKPCGGGGTDFRPAFKAVEQWEEQPVCIIYLTDLAGTFPEHDPGIPTLWVTGQETKLTAPFGEVLCAA